jgi:5-methylcytosine-specific restriction protein A
VTESPSAAAQRLLVQAADALFSVAQWSSDAELVSVLATCEGVIRRLDRVSVEAVAALDRRGVFDERGYKSPVRALGDLLGWEGFEARRRVVAAEQVTPRAGGRGRLLHAAGAARVGRCPGRGPGSGRGGARRPATRAAQPTNYACADSHPEAGS